MESFILNAPDWYFWLNLTFRSTVLFLLAKLALRILPAISLRFGILKLTFVALVLLFTALFIPAIQVNIPLFEVDFNVWTENESMLHTSNNQQLIPFSEDMADANQEVASSEVWMSTNKKLQLGAFALWMLGCLVLWSWTLFDVLLLNILKAKADQNTPKTWQNILDNQCIELKIRRSVQLLQVEHVKVPLTFGFFRPVLVLPTSAKDWSDDRFSIVLLHELIHIKRGDYFWNLFTALVKSVFWFNPLIWLSIKHWRLLCEQSCDEQVLRAGVDRLLYAQELLDITRQHVARNRFRFSVALPMTKPSALKLRLQCILHAKDDEKYNSNFQKVRSFSLLGFLILPLFMITISRSSIDSSLAPQHIIDKIKMVAQDNDTEAFYKITPFLDHSSKEVRVEAAQALSELQHPDVVWELLAALNDKSPEVKIAVLKAMGTQGSATAFYRVRHATQSENPDIRRAALGALQGIGCLPAYASVSRHLKDSDTEVREEAQRLLSLFDDQKMQHWLRRNLDKASSRQWIAQEIADMQRYGTVADCAKLLSRGNAQKQQLIIAIFQQSNMPDTLLQLKEVL